MIRSGISLLRQLNNNGFIEFNSLFKTTVCILRLCGFYMLSTECLFLKFSVIYSNPGHSLCLTMLDVKGDGKKERLRKDVTCGFLLVLLPLLKSRNLWILELDGKLRSCYPTHPLLHAIYCTTMPILSYPTLLRCLQW